MHLSFQADDVLARHSLLQEVGRRWGASARLVLQEFIANAAEHCANHRVDLDISPVRLVATDYGGGVRCARTRKPEGEGGYGLRLIRKFGGALSRWERGMRLELRLPTEPGGPERRTQPLTLTSPAALSPQ